MKRELIGTVGEDGVLRVAVGLHLGGRTLRVVVDEEAQPAMTRKEWLAFLDGIAGKWQGDFERLQEEFVERRVGEDTARSNKS